MSAPSTSAPTATETERPDSTETTTESEPETETETETETESEPESEDVPLPTAWILEDYADLVPTAIDDNPPAHGGFDIIKAVEDDHRYCSHCFRKLKSIELPPEHSTNKGKTIKVTDAAVGFQFPEIHTIQTYVPRSDSHSVDYYPWRAEMWKVDEGDGALRPARSCSCGCISPRTRRRPVDRDVAIEFMTNLSVAAWELHYEHMHLSTLAADATAFRHFRIASALVHDLDALRVTIKQLKSSPELTTRNMRGSWDPRDDYAPDDLFRQAFDLAASKGSNVLERGDVPSIEEMFELRHASSDPALDLDETIREQRRHRRRRYRGGREPPRRRRQRSAQSEPES